MALARSSTRRCPTIITDTIDASPSDEEAEENESRWKEQNYWGGLDIGVNMMLNNNQILSQFILTMNLEPNYYHYQLLKIILNFYWNKGNKILYHSSIKYI